LNNQKVYTTQQAYLKAAKFCAYQERTQQEVREKIKDYGFYGDEVEEVICRLIEDNFINEERFAKVFAGGKFRLKKWGKLKIENALRQKGISEYCIKQGLAEIEEEDYLSTLASLIEKKIPLITAENEYIRNHKLAQFLIQKGYESELVWKTIKDFKENL
jgi:regulatory protein